MDLDETNAYLVRVLELFLGGIVERSTVGAGLIKVILMVDLAFEGRLIGGTRADEGHVAGLGIAAGILLQPDDPLPGNGSIFCRHDGC